VYFTRDQALRTVYPVLKSSSNKDGTFVGRDSLILYQSINCDFHRYAHRALPSLLVHEIEVFLNHTATPQNVGMDLFNNSGSSSSDIDFKYRSTPLPYTVVYSGNLSHPTLNNTLTLLLSHRQHDGTRRNIGPNHSSLAGGNSHPGLYHPEYGG